VRRGRADEVADELLDLVVRGVFPVGRPLPSEAELATRFGVSRLTVREAIRLLASTRVLDVRQGRSSVVNPVELWSPLDGRLLAARSQVEDGEMHLARRLLEARRAVEVAIAELAAVRRDEVHLERLARAHEEMQRCSAQGDVDGAAEADLTFHGLLFAAADNVFLTALVEPLTEVLRTLRRRTSSVPEIRAHALDRHAAILQAVVGGDAAAAGEAMRDHLLQTEEDTVHYLGADLSAAPDGARAKEPGYHRES
jgi:DNA-binding FadR family transcriptional regulator